MKLIEIHEFYNSYHDDASNIIIELIRDNGETMEISIGEGEPEDMYLFRDLSDVYQITDLIKMAYDAGKVGEDYDYEAFEEKEE
jgi:hypothetical protein